MTIWSDLFPDAANLLARKFFLNPGTFNFVVPSGAKVLRATAQGCGGQGANYGGSGALVRSKVLVTAGDNLKIQCGNTSTASTPGDSWVRRNDNSIICYADRGRGNSSAGLASLSIGDIKRDGNPGQDIVGKGGLPSTDAGDYAPVGFGGSSINNPTGRIPASSGGGGVLSSLFDEFGLFLYNTAPYAAGCGKVCLEFFDNDPGY